MTLKETLLTLVRAIKKLLMTNPDQTAELEAAKAEAKAANEQLAALKDQDTLTDAEKVEVDEVIDLVAKAQPPTDSGVTGQEGTGE